MDLWMWYLPGGMSLEWKVLKKNYGKGISNRQEILNFENSDWDKISEEDFRLLFKKSSVKRTKFSGLDRNIQHNKKNFNK